MRVTLEIGGKTFKSVGDKDFANCDICDLEEDRCDEYFGERVICKDLGVGVFVEVNGDVSVQYDYKEDEEETCQAFSECICKYPCSDTCTCKNDEDEFVDIAYGVN